MIKYSYHNPSMNSRLIHTLFELAPLAPIGMICGSYRPSFMIPSIDKDNEIYLALTKETPTMRAYWGLNEDLEQAEKTAESAAEMVLDDMDEESFDPVYKPLQIIHPIQSTLLTTHGVVMVMERGGTTYYNKL